MTKKEFQNLITENKDIYKGLTFGDATVRYNYTYCCIQIYWRGHLKNSWIKVLKGRSGDLKNQEAMKKYKRWASELNIK